MTKQSNASSLNVISVAQIIGASDKKTEIENARLVEYLKANPKEKESFKRDYMIGHMSGKMEISLDAARAILTKAGVKTQDPERRTQHEHNHWKTAKNLAERLIKRAGLSDEKRVKTAKRVKTGSNKPDEVKVEKTPKAESKIPVYKKPDELATYNVLHLAELSKVNDANAATVKNSELLQKIARIVRDAKAEIDRAIKSA